MKKCPFCGEEIQDIAKKCRYCGERLNNYSQKHELKKPELKNAEYQTKNIHQQERETGFSKDIKKIEENLAKLKKNNNFLSFLLNYVFFFSQEKRLSRTDFILSFIGMIIMLVIIIWIPGIGGIISLYLIICFIEKIIKRLHDINRPGRNIIGFGIPILNILVILSLLIRKGTSGENKYGPKAIGSGIKLNKFLDVFLTIILSLLFLVIDLGLILYIK